MGVRSPYNSEGTEHLYSSDSTPVKEAAEIARLARAMKGVNTHRRSANDVFNPGSDGGDSTSTGPVSAGERYRKQQLAAAENDPGNSTVGENTPLVQQARKNLARQQALRTGQAMP